MRDFLNRNAVSGRYMLKWGLILLAANVVGYLAGTSARGEQIRAYTLGGLITFHITLWVGTFFIGTYLIEWWEAKRKP